MQKSYQEQETKLAEALIAKQKAENLQQQALTKYEDEVRLRIDFEIKINKLHNLNMSLSNHKATLDENIKDLEVELARSKTRIGSQDEEIVNLKLENQQKESTLANSKSLIEEVGRQNDKMKRKVRDTTEKYHEALTKADELKNLNT